MESGSNGVRAKSSNQFYKQPAAFCHGIIFMTVTNSIALSTVLLAP